MAVAEYSGPLSRPGRTRTWLRGLSLTTTLAAFALVVLGGIVRVTGSGLGCPDWPLCHGGVLPPPRLEAIIEYSHRLVASALVGPLVVATCVYAWVAYRRERWLVAPATAAVMVMLLQALLGGIAVLNELPGPIVATHLALGETLLGLLILVVVVAYTGPLTKGGGDFHNSRPGRFPLLALISGIGAFAVLMTGSYVTVSGATGACLGWPLCHGQFFPETGPQTVHMAHRLAAAVIGILLTLTIFEGFGPGDRSILVRSVSMAAGALFLGQVIVGAAAVLLSFPVELKALHLALATLLWGAMVALASLSFARTGLSQEAAAHA